MSVVKINKNLAHYRVADSAETDECATPVLNNTPEKVVKTKDKQTLHSVFSLF